MAIQTWTETCPFRAEAGTQNACPSHHEESKIAHGFCGVVMVREISRGGKEEEGSLNGGGDEAKVMESESRSACGNEVEEIVNGSGRESGKGSAVVEMESAGGLLGKVNDGVGFCFVGQHFDTALCNPCWVFPGLCLEEAGVASFPSFSDSHPLLFLSWPYPPPVSSTVPFSLFSASHLLFCASIFDLSSAFLCSLSARSANRFILFSSCFSRSNASTPFRE